MIRRHWTIENGLHWVLDVTFREDDSRVRNRTAARNLAILRKIAINLMGRNRTPRVSMRARRKQAAWNDEYMLAHRRQQMGQRPAQAVELPDVQAIARPQERQRFRQSRPIVTAAAGVILEQVAFIDPGAKKSVSLEVGRLTLPVGRDPHVANKHVRKTLRRRYPHITSFR